MRIKRVMKRLCAVGAGLTMLGATAMGAMAADLSQYPDMFVTDGTYNGLFVVGENAAAVDNLAMTDIAASMKTRTGGGTATTVSGDAWMVGTSSKFLEIANSNASDSSIGGETFRDISNFIDDEEMGALADGEWSTNENDYGFQQFMFFDAVPSGDTGPTNSRIVKYTENDDDVTADHLYIKSGRQIARYKMEFTTTAQSDVTDSTGTADTTGEYLDDFEDTQISFLGKDYSIVQARKISTTVQGDDVKLIMMSGSTRDTLLEGESKTYNVGEKEYDVSLNFVDSDEGKFTVNGEATNKLKVGETYVLSDGSEIGVSEVLYQAYAGGVHSVTFYVGASKIELRDDDIDAAGSSYSLKYGSENVDGTTSIITGTNDNTTTTISTIELNMSAEDDYFVGSGELLSDVIAAAGEEKEVLFNGGFDIMYAGFTEEETNELRLKSSGSRKYDLQLFDGDGNQVDIPVAYIESQYNISMGADTQVGSSRQGWKRLMLNETRSSVHPASWLDDISSNNIYKDDYFIVTGGTDSDGSAKSYLIQYKGADKSTDTSPKVKFKNMGSGESLDYSVTDPAATGSGATATVATIKLGGYSFIVENASSTLSDDFQINVDLNAGGSINAVNGDLITFVDYYGTTWTFLDYTTNATHAAVGPSDGPGGLGNSSDADFLTITQTTPNGDDYDNIPPTNLVLNITGASGPELRAALTGVTLLTPDGETEVSYGYTSMGTFIQFDEPASDADELTMTYPASQRLPQVYLTSGATAVATSATGDLTAVAVVDATKLDSEIASVSAQNLIVVGGPCVNTVAAELMGNPASCVEGFTPGKARVKLFEQTNGNMAMLVAGYSGADTRLAGKVIAHRWSELSGDEVEIEGTTYSDATIGAPASME